MTSLKERKITDVKPEDAVAKCTFHPIGAKFVNCGIILNCLVAMRNGLYAPFVEGPSNHVGTSCRRIY